jgi:hypothetical protein
VKAPEALLNSDWTSSISSPTNSTVWMRLAVSTVEPVVAARALFGNSTSCVATRAMTRAR